MNHCSTLRRAFVLVLAFTPVAGSARAEDAAPPTRAEFAKLQNEVKEQRSLIIQLMQSDQQRYDMLLRLMQGQATVAAPPSAPAAEEAPDGGEIALLVRPHAGESNWTHRRGLVMVRIRADPQDDRELSGGGRAVDLRVEKHAVRHLNLHAPVDGYAVLARGCRPSPGVQASASLGHHGLPRQKIPSAGYASNSF